MSDHDERISGTDDLKDELLRLRRELEASETERRRLQAKLDRSKETISFQLGQAILNVGRSPASVFKLPSEFSRLAKEAQRRRKR